MSEDQPNSTPRKSEPLDSTSWSSTPQEFASPDSPHDSTRSSPSDGKAPSEIVDAELIPTESGTNIPSEHPSNFDPLFDQNEGSPPIGLNDQFPNRSEFQSGRLEPARYNEPAQYRRRKLIPAMLFLLTLLSTFFVGVCEWNPSAIAYFHPLEITLELRKLVLANWDLGLTYMFCVVLILFCHEMGHFIATLIYRVPASLPIFLPFPVNPIGTLGAVIAMHGMAENRRQIFDIGIAGPLAGLVPAIPIAFWGIGQLDLTEPAIGGLGFRLPLLMQWFADWHQVPGYQPGAVVWLSQLNPLFVAGWVGFLITGINMMPVGQLDGGHVTYTLFGRTAHWIARITVVLAIAFMVYHQHFILTLMVVLLILIGTDHPPTEDDRISLNPFRYVLGLLSLSIPVLCFPPLVFQINY